MGTNFLVLDVNGLAWRAFHTTGGLSYRGTVTGVTFGVLSAVLELEGRFNTRHVAFCFDCGRSIRSKALTGYKLKRRQKRDAEDESIQIKLQQVREQIDSLRDVHLPRIGYRNIFSQKGYEADDCIASCVQNLGENDRAVIVSADKDMHQLLNKRVKCFNPITKELLTRKLFKQKYGITPKQYIDVKALAGCSTDEIPGIKGIGEATAIKYIRGELKSGVKYSLIKNGTEIYERNLPLVKLPYKGLTPCIMKRDKKALDWQPVLKVLGIRSLDPEVSYLERK